MKVWTSGFVSSTFEMFNNFYYNKIITHIEYVDNNVWLGTQVCNLISLISFCNKQRTSCWTSVKMGEGVCVGERVCVSLIRRLTFRFTNGFNGHDLDL